VFPENTEGCGFAWTKMSALWDGFDQRKFAIAARRGGRNANRSKIEASTKETAKNGRDRHGK